MNVHPFRGILKANRGHVCLSCLLKQSAPRYRLDHRFQSTSTESTPSSTTDSGFVVEGGSLAPRQGGPSNHGSPLRAKSHDKPPGKQQAAEASRKEGKTGHDNAGIHDREAEGAEQKTKMKRTGKNNHKPAVASDGTASAAPPIEQVSDSGEASRTGKSGTTSAPKSTPAKTRKGRSRKAVDRRRKGNGGQGVIRAKSSDGASGAIPRRVRGINRKEQNNNNPNQANAISPQGMEGPLQESNKDQSSSAPNQPALPRKVETTPSAAAKSAMQRTAVSRGLRSIRKAAQLIGRANGEKRKASEERQLRHEQVKSKLKKSLESSVEAQMETLKAKDKAEKTIETKAKRPRKISPKTASGPPRKRVAVSKPKTISRLDGNMSLKDALKAHSSPALDGLVNDEIEQLEANELIIAPVEIAQPPVPGLSYGLERVLFNPGVYHVQDPRSRVFNFDPYLQKIMPVAEFDFNALKEYITSSRDESLKALAQEHGKRYVGSSSSMTGALAHFHFLLSQWRPINTSMLSQGFPDKLRSFTLLQRCPSAIFLRWKNGTYAIDADKEFDTANVLSMLGKSMEKFLTLPTEDFERYRKTSSGQVSEEERNSPESFHYCTMGDFLMRSQLDAFDARLPGTGMFDLKTRAVVSIRMDAKHYEQGVGYQIKKRHGEWESFEREFFDMIRSAFLKYSLQVRMGRMDGIFVAFHNTERIFGFQYISVPEMDNCLHGQWDTIIGDQEFKLSLSLLNKALDRATKKFPEQSLRIHFETRELATPFMYIFAEPVTEEQVQEIQSRNKSKIEEFERRILGLHSDPDEDAPTSKSVEEDTSDWKDIHAKVEEELTKDELSSATTSTQSPEAAVPDVTSDDSGPEGSLDASPPVESGTLPAQSLTEEGFEQSAAPAVDEADEEVDDEEEEEEEEEGEEEGEEGEEEEEDEEEEDNADEDEDDVEEESGEEDQEEDETARVEVGEEEIASGAPEDEGLVHDRGEGDLKESTIEELAAVETPSSEDIIEEPNRHGEHETSGVLQEESTSKSEGPAKKAKKVKNPKEQTDSKDLQHSPLLAMTLTVRNKVNDKYVLRPEKLDRSDKWAVEYALAEIPSASRAWSLYGACQMRRKKKLDDDDISEEDVAKNYYLRRIRELSEQGRKWRKQQDRIERKTGKVVLDQPNPSSQAQADGSAE